MYWIKMDQLCCYFILAFSIFTFFQDILRILLPQDVISSIYFNTKHSISRKYIVLLMLFRNVAIKGLLPIDLPSLAPEKIKRGIVTIISLLTSDVL